MFERFRRVENQAPLALWLALISWLPAAAAGYAVYDRFDPHLRAITYGRQSLLLPALAGCLFLACLLSFSAVVLGLNSAGRRRNPSPGRSWLGFFLGMLSLTFALMAAVAFALLRLATA